MPDDCRIYQELLGITPPEREEHYDYSENHIWYSGHKSKEEELMELHAAWKSRDFIVADV